MKDSDINPLLEKGTLAMFALRDGTFTSVLVLNWEASLDWIEVLFNSSNKRQWVRAPAVFTMKQAMDLAV